MDFDRLLAQVQELLRQQGRVSYRALKLRFALDDEVLATLKDELIHALRVARDENDRVLVWGGQTTATPRDDAPPAEDAAPAERRQITVLFCDLVDSTGLSTRLDPEELREVVRAYQETSAGVIARLGGHIAQYLGDGLLVYFGYPLAHEDDARRAVRAGLGIIEALEQLNRRLMPGVQLAARVGVHTGLVVVGEMGGADRRERLALGETPNVAARLQSLATPDAVVVSEATVRLLGGFFTCQPLGAQSLKGLSHAMAVYRVVEESGARSRLEAAGAAGLTPLVGRDGDFARLVECWTEAADGSGRVVLLGGEAGIGKSRLVEALRERVATESRSWLTPCQCSAYHQNSALHPIIDLLERSALGFEAGASIQAKTDKLVAFLERYDLPLAEVVPLFTDLLSLPPADGYAPLTLSPDARKAQTLRALSTIFLRLAAREPVLFVVEDLHWVDPSTLELLSMLIERVPAARMLALFTFRPDWRPPWSGQAGLTEITLRRLPREEVEKVIRQVARDKTLPSEVEGQIVAKTDGVPLFVEELTRMVLESGLLREGEARYELDGPLPPLAIPTTLHDSLMARLDRLSAVKSLAQLGATLGREFSYRLLQAISPWDAQTTRSGLRQLVEAEFLVQRGNPPESTYLFKHALIQDAAYQSLLRRTRQQHHERIAQVLQSQFPEVADVQPELVGHHYTEAGLPARAVEHWLRAGERSSSRSAYLEAVAHCKKGLEVLRQLPDDSERTRKEFLLQTTLGPALMATRGPATPEAAVAYDRAIELCRHVGDTPQLFTALAGMWQYYLVRAEYRTARELAERLLGLAEDVGSPALRVQAHRALGEAFQNLGELAAAREHLTRGSALYESQQHRSQGFADPGVFCLALGAWVLWLMGYPARALEQCQQALALARGLSNAHTVAAVQYFAAMVHRFRRERGAARERAEEAIAMGREQNLPHWIVFGTIVRGWALAMEGQGEEGIAQIREGLTGQQFAGARISRGSFLVLLIEAHLAAGQVEAGLAVVAEALALMEETGGKYEEAETYRLNGELLLAGPGADATEAEASFQRALAVARRAGARSWELRAAVSLARLWQSQGRPVEARELLAPVRGWFSEGFDTHDLREATALLEQVSRLR